MTATETFVRAAVAGGANIHFRRHPRHAQQVHGYFRCDWCEEAGEPMARDVSFEQILLDPETWRCAGKSLGWNDIETNPKNYSWLERWHGLIDHLANGKTADAYLATLTDAK